MKKRRQEKHNSDQDEQHQQQPQSFEGLLSGYRPMIVKERKVYHEHPSIGNRKREIMGGGAERISLSFLLCFSFPLASHVHDRSAVILDVCL